MLLLDCKLQISNLIKTLIKISYCKGKELVLGCFKRVVICYCVDIGSVVLSLLLILVFIAILLDGLRVILYIYN